MPQPADETRLGELLVTTGKLSSEELLAALETQRHLGGPGRKRLGEILVERGHLSFNEVETILNRQAKQILWCPRCRVQVNVQGAVPGGRYGCQGCGGLLEPPPAPRSPAAKETWPAMPVPVAEEVSEEVSQALADPVRRVGRYVVLSELGRGGMGVVHRCYDPQLNRTVAIKMLLDDMVANPDEDTDENLARFKREALAAAKIQHPGIVGLHEVGEHEGRPYLVMDFVEGRSFDALLKHEKPTARHIADIICQVALALDHAHDRGIIHRDIKPQNVMVDPHGKPHVMDFGLARDSSAQQQLTKTGQIMGTPVYMAPEQVGGGELGPWTDIYALGVMLYRALTGRPPFTAGNPTVLFKQILMDEPKRLRSLDQTISQDLETITLKCLEKDPDGRYPSAAAVAEELQHFLNGQAILARPIGRMEMAIRWMRCNRALSGALAVVALIFAGSLVGGVAMYRKHQAELETERINAAISTERAKQEAKAEATSTEQERAREDLLKKLRSDMAAILDRVRSGETLADRNESRIQRSRILRYHEPETVDILTAELDALSTHLAQSHWMSPGMVRFLRFLCEALADLGMQEDAVASLGFYLRTELALPTESQDQLRAVAAGKALCLLGGEEAERLVLEGRDGFSDGDLFWGQVLPLYVQMDGLILDTGTSTEFYKRGVARFEKQDFDGALADLSLAIELGANNASVFHLRGVARHKVGDQEGALADLSRAIEINPDDGSAWSNRGYVRYVIGDFDGAIADCTHAVGIDPSSKDAWSNRCSARLEKGDYDGAIADGTRAIEIDPKFALAWSSRGAARHAKGDFVGAMDDCSRAIEIDPNHPFAWNNRGRAYQAMAHLDSGYLDVAIGDFTRAIEINPYDEFAWNNRGYARAAKGDISGAIADYSQALDINPSDRFAWRNRGMARRSKGDISGAIADFSRALEIDARNAKALCYRGDARQTLGDIDGAIADWQRFLELAPNAPEAPAIRAALPKLRQRQGAAGN